MPPPPRMPLDFAPATGPEPTLIDTIGAAFQDAQVKNSNEEKDRLADAVNAAWAQLEAEGGDSVRAKLKEHWQAARGPETNANLQWERLAAMESYRATLPKTEQEKVPTRDQLVERGREVSIARYYDAQDVLQRGAGGWNAAAQFVGGAAGAMTDPINLASMIALRYPAQGILATIGIEAAGGALTQALIEPQTYSYMNDLGIEYSIEDSVNSILQAGVGAGVLGGVIRTGEKVVVRAGGDIPIDELRQLEKRAEGGDAGATAELAQYNRDRILKALEGVRRNDPDVRAAESIVRDVETIERENPFAMPAEPDATAGEAITRHQVEVIRADETLQHGRAITPPQPGEAAPLAPARTPEGVELVDLSTLQRAPELFQYKEADLDGVTPALRGIDTWAPERAGLVIAWERKDGTRFVVDGHQRHALAQRLREQGHGPISAPVFVLREADGVSSSQAMVKAAAKNIGEGSGTALDAAYILRTAPADQLKGLPPNSALVKAAAGLARLSGDAFGMVVNGADERWGALVGRLVEDQGVQAQVLQAVSRMEPDSAAAAESMIRDMLAAPRVESQTMDLFGASTTSELLIAERAKVKQAAMALLGRNRAAFKAALARQFELEQAGNVLAAKRNREVLDADTAAALRLEKDAHLKGWVSDALSQAAKDLRDGASLAKTVEGLVGALRRGEGGVDPGGSAARGAGADAGRAGAAGREGQGGGSQAKRSPETLSIDLGRSSFRKAQDGADKLDVLVNPTDAALKRLTVLPAAARKDGMTSASLRYLKDDAGNLYVWRGDLAVHPEVAAELKLDAAGKTPAQGKVELDQGKLLWDGTPDRPGAPVSKKSLREGGPIAWRRELTREDAMTDDLDRALNWLSAERKEVVAEVRDSFLDDAAPASATKADLMTELREAVRQHHVKAGEGADVPPSLFDDDPDVSRMRAAEDELRMPIADEGAAIAAAADADAAGPAGAKAAEDLELDEIEASIVELRKIEESDPRVSPAMFVDPDTGKLRPVSDIIDELKYDRERTQVLEFCAYPGGKARA